MLADFTLEQVRNLAIVTAFCLLIVVLFKLAVRIGERRKQRIFDEQDPVRDVDHQRGEELL